MTALRAGFRRAARGSASGLLNDLSEIADFVLPFAGPVWRDLDEARARGRRILFEGRAGRAARRRPRHLPVRHFVNTVAGTTGSGAAWAQCGRVRARHRQGLHHARRIRPFPTEQENEIGQRWASAGTSSAPSPGAAPCGWFDACSSASRSRSAASPASR
jgi:adenylosuccinate synthase